jgi:hypothetical protein
VKNTTKLSTASTIHHRFNGTVAQNDAVLGKTHHYFIDREGL